LFNRRGQRPARFCRNGRGRCSSLPRTADAGPAFPGWRVQDQTSEIVMMDAVALSRAIRNRAVSCVEVMTGHLDQIERLNPRVNAIVALRERAALLAEAEARDEQLARGEYLGWMHGFPQAVKDLAPAKGLPYTQGSPLFADRVAETDAIFVERMRRAGSIIIGKTNTPEFGLGSQTFNPVYGTTRNAYDTSRTSGGSSGGAAVALATRMLPVADGSDHAGSLRNPAAFNNVFGLRPSFGVVPSETDPFTPALGVAGPMARSVPDLAMLLSVMAGYDPRAPLSHAGDPAAFTESLERDVRGIRIGWLGDFAGYLPFEPGVLDLCRAALKTFEALGCHVEEGLPDYPVERVWRNWLKLRAVQVGAGLKDLYQDPAKRERMKPELRWEVESGLRLGAYEVAEAALERGLWHQSVSRLFERYDYLVLPSAQVFPFAAETPWPKEIAGREMTTYHRWMEVVIPVTMSGCPALSVPVGFNEAGLPMGMQIVAPVYAERACLQLGHAYDVATGWVDRRLPDMVQPVSAASHHGQGTHGRS
jgi:amidase